MLFTISLFFGGIFPLIIQCNGKTFPKKYKKVYFSGKIFPFNFKEVYLIENYIFLPENEKQNVSVGFSKKDIKNHKGISRLKYYLIVLYLRKHLETFGEVNLTLNKLLEECGYSTKSHNQSIYSDFREIIKTEIINKGFASCNVDIFTVNPTELFTISLSEKKNLFYSKDNFVQINIGEYERITHYSGKTNKSVLLGVYLFIKQYILVDSEMNKMLPKISYPSKQQIKKGIGVSSIPTIENAISILTDMKLIYIRSDMFIENSEEEGVYVPTRNVFALNQEELNNDVVLLELENLYGRTVYNKEDVPGRINYLIKEKA